MSDNLRASLLMVASMAGFAVEDLLIKLLSATLPIGQMLFMLGIGGAGFFALVIIVLRQHFWSPDLTSGPFLLRSGAEMFSTMAGVTALSLIPLSLASSILQAAPLLVTIGAAVFLGEQVGWRRWTAIGIGLLGVLLILRPGSEGFDPAVWLAVAAVFALAVRDLATRATTMRITTLQLTFWGFLLSVPSGLIVHVLMNQTFVVPSGTDWVKLAAVQVLGITFYFTLTLALRLGEASVVVPFRYSRLVFALALGILVLGESLDAMMIAGLILVTGSGLYTLMREARRNAANRRATATKGAA